MVAPGERAWRRTARRARRVTLADAGRSGRWLLLAPHPDDETLMAGALIAALAAGGAPPVIAYLTDGSGSHRDAPGWSPARVARLRGGEARRACRALGVRTAPVTLGWRDAAPFDPAGRAFARSRDRLGALCRRHCIGTIVTTWAGDPHCDHHAASRLAAAIGRRLTRYETPVWGWPALADRHRAVALATARHRPAARRALACHASQRGGRIAGGDAFRLPRAMTGLVARPLTLLLEPRDAP